MTYIKLFVLNLYFHDSVNPHVSKLTIHSFIHSYVHSFICSFIHSFIRSFIHSLTRSFIHSLVHSFTHLLTLHLFINSLVSRRLCPDLSFFQSATKYPNLELVSSSAEITTLRKRVEQSVLKAQNVSRNRSGITVTDVSSVCRTRNLVALGLIHEAPDM